MAAPRRRRGRGRILAAALLLAGCGNAAAADTAPLRLAATVQPLALLAEAVGGARLEIQVLVPPGANPHTFEPRPRSLSELAHVQGFLHVGGGLDDWSEKLLEALPSPPPGWTLLASPGLDPLPGDPHAWLDPLRVRDAVVPSLVAWLAGLDPAGAAHYREAGARFAARLLDLDAELRRTLAPAGRRFVAFHASWRYFAQRYGLEEVGVVEEAPGEEPSPRELAALADAARAASVPAILVEPQLDPRIARTLAAEYGAATRLVDPLGDPGDPARASYVALLRFDARAFAAALGPASP